MVAKFIKIKIIMATAKISWAIANKKVTFIEIINYFLFLITNFVIFINPATTKNFKINVITA